MRRIVSFGVSFGLLALVPSVRASTWEIDPAHTSAQFAVKHLMVSTVRGAFSKVQGSASVDEKDITKSSVDATIDVAGIDTRNPKRDEHLKSPDFFDVAKYPSMAFKSKKILVEGDGKFRITGDLTLHGVTREVVLVAEGSPKPMKDPFGKARLGGVATTTIDRKDFGLTWNKALETGGVVVGDDVAVTIDVELTRKD